MTTHTRPTLATLDTHTRTRRYFIAAREWFDTANSNTYHSIRVLDNDTGHVAVVPFRYGHGHAAIIDAAAEALGSPVHDFDVWIDCTRVARRKDLHVSPWG